MANQWFKFYGIEYLSDPKMMALTAAERSCWITLLCHASIFDEGGIVRHLTEERLMIQSGIEITDEIWRETLGVLEKFKKLSMITIDNVGDTKIIIVKNWNKRQEISLSGYERVKRWRERNRGKDNDDNTDDNSVITTEEKRIEEKRIEKKDIVEHFEIFWDLYPRKVSKKKSFDSWKKLPLTKELFEKIIKALKAQKESDQWTKDSGRFIPHPMTWLNQERWTDELLKVEAKKEELFIPSYAKHLKKS